MALTVILAALVASYLIYILIIYPYVLSPLRNVPGPGGNPIFGQFPTLIREEPGVPLSRWIEEHGPAVRLVGPLGIERLLLVSPEALARILATGWADYPRPGYLRKILGFVAGHGLLTVSGNEHKRMRKTMNQAFALSHLMAQTDMYYDSIDGLVDILSSAIATSENGPENGKQFDMYDWLGKAALDIISETAFGYKTDSLHNPDNELAMAFHELLSLQSAANMLSLIWIMSLPFGIGAKLFASDIIFNNLAILRSRWFFGGIWAPAAKLISSMRIIRRISSQMLAQKLRELSPEYLAIPSDDMEVGAKKDVMTILVRAKAEYEKQQQGKQNSETIEGYGMNSNAMMDQVLTFLAAGQETTASGLTWAMYLLASHPEVQNKLREEVTDAFKDGGRPDYRSLKDMQWLDCVIMESLRLFPPVPETVRIAATTDYIDGLLVPKGTFLYIPIRSINTWKETWGEDAAKYNPSRWLNLPKTYNPTYSFFSFISGPHACIGRTMAIAEMKAIVGALVTNFSFELAYPGQTAHPTAAITMKPADGMPLRLKRIARN
ncbi:cytochrome P450 [Mycena floridula]|nr:cytochrome P450 [Mycena floridula]